MTGFGVHLEGLDALEASLAAVVQALQDPETADDVARMVAAEAQPPVLTGALARSESVSGGRLVYAAPYAVIVHARQPWLGAAISDVVPRMVDLYAVKVQEAWT